MGQRLIITVEKDAKQIAKLYFHWSAYSSSSAMETADLIKYLDAHKDMDTRLACIRFAEEKGGCIDGGKESVEFKAISEMFPDETFKENGSRNNGLVALTEAGMSELQYWSDGDVTINLDNRTVLNWVNWSFKNVDDIKAENEDFDENLIIVSDIDICDYSFEDADYVYNICNEAEDKGNGYVKCGDVYYGMIY